MPDDDFGLDPSTCIEGTLLAFDFGTKKMGVAVGQTITKTARPLAPLKAQDGIPDWVFLTQLVNEWAPQGLVVGMPVNEGYADQAILLCAKKFARRLRHRFAVPVFGMDERLTTREARQTLFERGGKRALEKNSVDSMAAQLILESWLRTYCGDS